MHHWCRSARSACGPLRLRRARSARKTRWARGKRALQQSACRPARARRSLFLSCHALEIAPLRPSEGRQEALKAFELASRGADGLPPPYGPSGLPPSGGRAAFPAAGSSLTPRIGPDCARRDADFPFASPCASLVKPASDIAPPRRKLRWRGYGSALDMLVNVLKLQE